MSEDDLQKRKISFWNVCIFERCILFNLKLLWNRWYNHTVQTSKWYICEVTTFLSFQDTLHISLCKYNSHHAHIRITDNFRQVSGIITRRGETHTAVSAWKCHRPQTHSKQGTRQDWLIKQVRNDRCAVKMRVFSVSPHLCSESSIGGKFITVPSMPSMVPGSDRRLISVCWKDASVKVITEDSGLNGTCRVPPGGKACLAGAGAQARAETTSLLVGLRLDGPSPTRAAKGTVPQSWRLTWALPAWDGGSCLAYTLSLISSRRSQSQTSYRSNPEGLTLSGAALRELWVTSLLYLL